MPKRVNNPVFNYKNKFKLKKKIAAKIPAEAKTKVTPVNIHCAFQGLVLFFATHVFLPPLPSQHEHTPSLPVLRYRGWEADPGYTELLVSRFFSTSMCSCVTNMCSPHPTCRGLVGMSGQWLRSWLGFSAMAPRMLWLRVRSQQSSGTYWEGKLPMPMTRGMKPQHPLLWAPPASQVCELHMISKQLSSSKCIADYSRKS